MFLTSRNLPLISALVFVLLHVAFSGHVSAQEASRVVAPLDDWAGMIALQRDSDLRIDLASGQQATGRLVSATADAVTLLVGGGRWSPNASGRRPWDEASGSEGQHDQIVARETIRRVVLLGQRKTARYAKRGFITGAVAGGLMGTLGTKSNRLPWAAFLAGGWGGIAAMIGAIEGLSQRDESVVYVARVDGR